MTDSPPAPDGEPEVMFATSGHSGTPVAWIRSAGQLRGEASLVADMVMGELDEIVCFAPPGHLFGRLFGVILPQLRGVPVQQLHDDPVRAPRLRPGCRVLFICLPSSWLVLERMTDRIAALGSSVLLHGTGPVTDTTRRVVSALRASPARVVEIFGSTETGGIAVRPVGGPGTGHDQDEPWTLLPDVSLVPAEQDDPGGWMRLGVRSPRLARRSDQATAPDLLWLDDMIRPVGERSFMFLGRCSRLVKVNGKRIDLGAVERAASAVLGTDTACVPVRDQVRGEHYELFYAAGSEDLTGEQAWCRLASAPPAQPLPRALHQVPEIPRTATGKVDLGRLRATGS